MSLAFETGSSNHHRSSFCKRTKNWLAEDLDGDDWRLIGVTLLITLLSGMTLVVFSLDFPVEVFNQPGFLLRLATPLPSDVSVLLLATAFGCFIGSCFVVGQIGVQTDWKQTRAWLVSMTLLQALFTAAAAILRINNTSNGPGELMLPEIGLMALTGGIQIATLRILSGRVNKCNTIQFFGAMVNMLIDKNLWKRRNAGRDVRLLFVASIIAGGSLGVWIYNETWQASGSACTLLVCAGIKGTVIAGMLLLVPRKKVHFVETEDQEKPMTSRGHTLLEAPSYKSPSTRAVPEEVDASYRSTALSPRPSQSSIVGSFSTVGNSTFTAPRSSYPPSSMPPSMLSPIPSQSSGARSSQKNRNATVLAPPSSYPPSSMPHSMHNSFRRDKNSGG